MRRVISRLLVAFLAVGVSAAGVSSSGPAGADVAWGTPSEVAASLNTGGDAVINSVSCPSDGNCAAVGYYKDSAGNTQAFDVDEVAGTWGTPSEVAASLNTGGDAWVNSVSCPSNGNCAAGGRYKDSAGNYQNFVVDEVAGTWGTASEVAGSLNAGGHAWVNSVSCHSNGNCAAGGRYKDSAGNYQNFVVDEVAGVWDAPSEVAGSLNTGGDGDTNSVSCSSNGNCAAGGRYKDSSENYQAFIVDEVAGTWDAPSEVANSLNFGGSAQVFSVSCTSDGNCAAGGRYKDSSGKYQAFVVDEVAGIWGTPSEVAGSLNAGGLARVWSVSCTSDGNCAAGGRYKESSGSSQSFVVDEVGGTWGTPSEVAGSLNTGGDAWINSVSCASNGNCAAGGYYKEGSGNHQSFVVDEVGGTWGTPSEVGGSLNAGGDGEPNSVSCNSDGSCVAGGFYKEGSGNIQAFLLDEVYTVTFDANGGSGTISTESSTAGAAKALTSNAFTFAGYTFTGWNTAANGSGTAYTDGETYPFNANVTLYAQWSANSEDVSFNANGGRGTISAESYTTGVAKALTANVFSFAGHSFTGWNTAANGSGTAYTDGQIISISAAISLYAQWIAKPLPKEIVKAHLSTERFGVQVHLHIHLFGKIGTVSGRVEVSFAGKTICSAALVDGVAVCSVNSSRLGFGSHRLLAKYQARGLYRSRSKSIVVRVG
ncbi:MAG: InlB B-repeat-containing protein [Acidimicrobiales bacterium]